MKPRLLADENVPWPAVSRLRRSGWDIVSIGELEPGASDERVVELARTDARWLITFDADFGSLVFLRRIDLPPLVLFLRVSSYRPDEPAVWFETLFDAGELREGALHVYDGRNIRRRRYPSLSKR